MIRMLHAQAEEAAELEARLEAVHEDVFGGSWIVHLMPIPALLGRSDQTLRVRQLREIEERLRLIRLACVGSEDPASARLAAYTDSLHAAATALRRIMERLQERRAGARYDIDEFGADMQRYRTLSDTHRSIVPTA